MEVDKAEVPRVDGLVRVVAGWRETVEPEPRSALVVSTLDPGTAEEEVDAEVQTGAEEKPVRALVRAPASPVEWDWAWEKGGQLVLAPVRTCAPVLAGRGTTGAAVPGEEVAVPWKTVDAVAGGLEGPAGVPRTVPFSVAGPDPVGAAASVAGVWACEPAPGEVAMSAGVERVPCQGADGATVLGAAGDGGGPVRPRAEVTFRMAWVASWDVASVCPWLVVCALDGLRGVLGMDSGAERSAWRGPAVCEPERC